MKSDPYDIVGAIDLAVVIGFCLLTLAAAGLTLRRRLA